MNDFVLTCPCCGQPVPPGQLHASSLSATLGLNGLQAALVDALAQRVGQWIPTQRVVSAMYADERDGGPETASIVVRVMATRVRPALARAGYAVESRHGGRGGGSYRRLVRVRA